MKIRKFVRHIRLHLRYRYLMWSLPDTNLRRGTKVHIQSLQGVLPTNLDTKLLIYAASDSLYFDKYAYAFIESILQNSSDICIHIHLFNPIEKQLQNLIKLKAITGLSYSWESVDLGGLDKEARGRYYYSMRFVRMAEVFENSKANCLCLDIDSLINSKLDRLCQLLTNIDVAFYARFNKRSMGTKLLAGTLYLRYSDLTMSFLSTIGVQIEKFILNGHLLEKLDQLIIYDNFKKLSHINPKVKFLAFDQNIIDIKFTDDGLIWYPKGQSKNQQKYQEKATEYKAAMKKRVASDSI